MDLINSPINDNSNEYENLVTNSEQNGPQNLNDNEFLFENRDQSSKDDNRFIIKFRCHYFYICIYSTIISFFIFVTIVASNSDKYERIFIFLLGAIIELMLLIFYNKKIMILKDTSNKKTIIKVINFLCFARKIIIFDLENIHFNIMPPINRLLIINDFKSLVGIDLDESNIKQKPAKYLYCFDNISLGRYSISRLTEVLNDFIGSPRNYKNPLIFNINKYLNKKKRKNYKPFSYMKFSDYFFTYHLLGEFNASKINNCCYDTIIILSGMLYAMGWILLMFGDKKIRLIVVAFLLVVNIIIYSLYKCIKFMFDNILRIDCIYSKNFDRIFIGLVKYTKTKYENTFEYQMDNIDRFILENGANNNNTTFNLKVVLKNNEIQQIYSIRKKTKAELEGLLYLLNERLNNNITQTNNSIDSSEN